MLTITNISLWNPWLQHYKRISRHTWTASSFFLLFFVFTCERAFVLDFSFGSF